jgi:hypothetical protein
MRDIDYSPSTRDGVRFVTRSTPYTVEWNSQTLTISYASKLGGEVSVRLKALDGGVVPIPSPAVVQDDSVRCFVGKDLELRVQFRPEGVEIFKILHNANAPKGLTWEVVEGLLSNIRLDLMNTSGFDNQSLLAARTGEFRRRRRIEMVHSRTLDDLLVNPGKKTYTVTETFTGRTRLTDPATRARSWVAGVVYPVEIDVTINETIVADADDGHEFFSLWYSSYGGVHFLNPNNNPGYRFQTVDVPQGVTIDSATLTLEVTSAGASGSLFGNDVDDAPVWADSAGPVEMTATTASVTLDATTLGTKALDVTAIVQEIVDRAGWAANQDMAFGVQGTITGYSYIADSTDGTPADDPALEIIYTAGGAGLAIPIAAYHYNHHLGSMAS